MLALEVTRDFTEISPVMFNYPRPWQNGRLFADEIFRCIVLFCFLVEISLIFFPKGHIDNNQALVQIMAWRRIGDKPLSEAMMSRFTDAALGGRWVKYISRSAKMFRNSLKPKKFVVNTVSADTCSISCKHGRDPVMSCHENATRISDVI